MRSPIVHCVLMIENFIAMQRTSVQVHLIFITTPISHALQLHLIGSTVLPTGQIIDAFGDFLWTKLIICHRQNSRCILPLQDHAFQQTAQLICLSKIVHGLIYSTQFIDFKTIGHCSLLEEYRIIKQYWQFNYYHIH